MQSFISINYFKYNFNEELSDRKIINSRFSNEKTYKSSLSKFKTEYETK